MPVKLGVWYMRTSTLPGKSRTKGARREAHEVRGDSRVPLRASVRMEILRDLVLVRASRRVAMSSCSDFPMYNVDI